MDEILANESECFQRRGGELMSWIQHAKQFIQATAQS